MNMNLFNHNRTNFFLNEDGSVTLQPARNSGQRTRTFTVAQRGGQILEDGTLACVGLDTRGEPISAPSRADLLTVIRREYARGRRNTGGPPGRPRVIGEDSGQCTVYLDATAMACAVMAGDGNMSAGIRAALAEWMGAEPGRREAVLKAVG